MEKFRHFGTTVTEQNQRYLRLSQMWVRQQWLASKQGLEGRIYWLLYQRAKFGGCGQH